MIQTKFLPVLAFVMAVLAACSARASTATPSLTTATSLASASPATPMPASTDTSIPTAVQAAIPPALPLLASPALVRIDFQDAHNGWGLAVNANGNGYVLRSVDGGSTWYNATPPGVGPIGLSAGLTVLDTNHAWVLLPGSDFFSGRLYRTSDGGISWSSNTVSFSGAFIQFQDASHALAMANRGAGAGAEAVELFQTSDGGVTWASVFHDDPGQSGSSDSLPLAGIKNGLTFRDTQTGWVTGSLPINGEVYLYITHDGGFTWSHQGLPLPAGYEKYQYLAQAPVFFGQAGFLPLIIYRAGSTDLTFFTTQDGGLTWTGDPANAGTVIKACQPAVADVRLLWCWDGGVSLYSSTDGAQTWAVTNPGLGLGGNLSRLEFVPGSTGWALTRLDDAGHSQLYRTTDGVNWTRLIP